MGSKHSPLTRQEVENSTLPLRVIQLLDAYAEQKGTSYASIRVLDWGCGRGQTVIQLLQLGIDAYGVDIDPEPISNGSPVMAELGFEPQKRLLCINPDCKIPFDDGFFHIILSDQVFEHVSDLPALAQELSRVTCPGGLGLHFFPSQYCIVEPHLLIPFVHWLPKNKLRSWWIRLMFDKIPVWYGLDDASVAERVDTYYQYSLQKTYYRSLKEIELHLTRQNLEVHFLPSGPPGRKHRLLVISHRNKASLLRNGPKSVK